jgi:5'-nucleotidase
MAANVTTLSFSDPVAATIREAKSLRERGADLVIVIAHMGGRCNDMNDVHDVGSCSQQQEAMQFLAALPPGTIDAYFGGHTHSQMRQFINGVPAVQALAYSREFATLDLYVDPASHHVRRTSARTR